jgi:hypothetical protein
MKRDSFLIRLPVKDAAMLRQAAKSYRAPSVTWFVNEMVRCMLNPQMAGEFVNRLLSGAVQEQIDLGQLDAPPRRAAVVAGTRKRVSRRGKRGGRPV